MSAQSRALMTPPGWKERQGVLYQPVLKATPCPCAGWESSEDDEDVCACGHNYDMHTGSGECQAGRE